MRLSTEALAVCISGVASGQLLELGEPALTRFPSQSLLVSVESILMSIYILLPFVQSLIKQIVALKMLSY